MAAIEQRFEPLLSHPELGPKRDEIASGLRVIFHRNYAIYYAVEEDAVVIARVLHGARDARAVMTSKTGEKL